MGVLLDGVKVFDASLGDSKFNELREVFPETHFKELKDEGFPFYQTTFWYPLDRKPNHVFEEVCQSLKPLAAPMEGVTGVEWWFSVMRINSTPQWLLECHFDRADLGERDHAKTKHPEKSSVLFLNSVPYGELAVTDQVLTNRGRRPHQPRAMQFIEPEPNRYATFPGTRYHGVIGRMWRPECPDALRISMAINWWADKPVSDYMADSAECFDLFDLPTSR